MPDIENPRSPTVTIGRSATFRTDFPVQKSSPLSLAGWTLGRGAVIWRIWPAVLLHTVIGAVVVTLTMKDIVNLGLPSVMLEVLGVVIGFAITYRASSGYDRYWTGRSVWSQIIRNCRTLGRLVWMHCPNNLTPKTGEERQSGKLGRSADEMKKAMDEKTLAMDLVEAFAVAVKHHVRAEYGVHYEDLYPLVKPVYDEGYSLINFPTLKDSTRKALRRFTEPTSRHKQDPSIETKIESVDVGPDGNGDTLHKHFPSEPHRALSMGVPPLGRHAPRTLLPAKRRHKAPLITKVSSGIIPFTGVVFAIRDIGRALFSSRKPRSLSENEQHASDLTWPRSPITPASPKFPPQIGEAKGNVPMEILCYLSDWFSILEDRGTVPGSLGTMGDTVTALEDNFATLEYILNTPLPYVYSVHISTCWLYLFFLPFQLVPDFGWSTIPGVAIAAFIYLGFFSVGEEMEQPFGYDDNDLDLDHFCRDVIHRDLAYLKSTSCYNAYFGSSD